MTSTRTRYWVRVSITIHKYIDCVACRCDPYKDEVLPQAPHELVCELSKRWVMIASFYIQVEWFWRPGFNGLFLRLWLGVLVQLAEDIQPESSQGSDATPGSRLVQQLKLPACIV